MVRLAAGMAAAMPPLAAAASLFLGRLDPGYDPVHATVSRLGEQGAPTALAMNAVMALLGLSLVGLAWALHAAVTGGKGEGPILLAAGGLALVAAALVRIDPDSGGVTAVHRGLTGVAFGCLALAPLRLAPRLRADPPWRRWAAPSRVLGWTVVALLAASVLLLFTPLPSGLWERALILAALAWVELLALRLLRSG